MPRRCTCRSIARSTVRRATRVPVRTRWRAPDDLATALAAFGRALQAHRRLARLAPRFFDSVVVERERRAHEARCRWMALWEPALAKIYGAEPKAPNPAPELPPLPPPHTQRAVDHELAAWHFWLRTGHEALERYARRRPHALVTFTRLVRLLELASRFGRQAAGVDSSLAAPDPDNHDTAWADLERAYGHRSDLDSSGPALSPSPAAPVANTTPPASPGQSMPAASSNPMPTPDPEPHSPPAAMAAPPAEPPRPGHNRRDAWSSWARHLRRRA